MDLHNQDSSASDSDCDVFFGKLTLEEVKKRLCNKSRDISSTSCYFKYEDCNDNETSLKIIEIHSTPNLLFDHAQKIKENTDLVLKPPIFKQEPTTDSKDNNPENVENLVTKLNLSPRSICNNNTPPDKSVSEAIESKSKNSANVQPPGNPEVVLEFNLQNHLKSKTPVKHNNNIKENEKPITNNLPRTPDSTAKEKSSAFKTPGKLPSSNKKNILTPKSKIPQFQNIASPVAFYIKNNPVPTLMKNVYPKKPMGGSSIPKPIKQTPGTSKANKENLNLPQVAYKSAKQTKMINTPSQQRLPQSQWSKQVISSIPKAIVIKHDHRENNSVKKNKEQENSFNDLSFHQADLSVCTQKSAFKK